MPIGPLFGATSPNFNNSMALSGQLHLDEDVNKDLRQIKRENELLKTMVQTQPLGLLCDIPIAHLLGTGPFPRS